jgi:uncharacterized protein
MLQPTPAKERYALLDVLRGFALLGVLIVNLSTSSGYHFLPESEKLAFSTAAADGVVNWLIHFLFDGKFYSLFSLLFGIGFALQMKRAEEEGKDFAGRYRRRLFILFLFGLVHAVFFYIGDILAVYAITGSILFLFRKASNKTILRSAIIILALPVIQYGIMLLLATNTTPATPAATNTVASFSQMVFIGQNGSFGEIVQNNITSLIHRRYPDLLFTGRFFRVLGMFLVGYYATRRMLFIRLEENKAFLKKLLTWGAVIGIPCNLALAMLMETKLFYGMQPLGILQPMVYAFGVPALCLFYTGWVSLSYTNNPGHKFLNLFLPVGRMALTNYLMQSLICCMIFQNYAGGWYALVGPLYLFIMALFIFSFQVIFSHWWLKRYRFGPMEWLWRSATYGKWQGMRVEGRLAV